MSDVHVHTAFAADIFGVADTAVTDVQKVAAKRALHFLAYSGTIAQMAAEIGVPVERLAAAWDRFERPWRKGASWIPPHERGPEYWCPNCGAMLTGPGRCC